MSLQVLLQMDMDGDGTMLGLHCFVIDVLEGHFTLSYLVF